MDFEPRGKLNSGGHMKKWGGDLTISEVSSPSGLMLKLPHSTLTFAAGGNKYLFFLTGEAL